jgi:two-component system, chemotaxis family, protein-glutamate methylesterase/glutaminase
MPPIKVLVVDDSAFMRLSLSRRLATDSGLDVVGTAIDGYDALEKVAALRPDVVTMDVEMPGLDGLGALAQIMAEHPVPVIMVSSLTSEGTETTVRALTLGAVDFIAKPTRLSGNEQLINDLAVKIRQAAGIRVRRQTGPGARRAANVTEKAILRPMLASDTVLAIGSSTGGPGALRQLMTDLSGNLNAAILIVQHMPPGFTRSLADRLNDFSAWTVKEAAAGDRLMVGQALVAPGGLHMTVNARGEIGLNSDPPVNNVRPAVDVMMKSVVEAFGRRVNGVILTGMGHDGTDGALLIKNAGGQVIVEAEATCAVYGMPRSVVEAGAADIIAPLPEIAGQILQALTKGSKSGR